MYLVASLVVASGTLIASASDKVSSVITRGTNSVVIRESEEKALVLEKATESVSAEKLAHRSHSSHSSHRSHSSHSSHRSHYSARF